jgi:hypothetical protein
MAIMKEAWTSTRLIKQLVNKTGASFLEGKKTTE